MTIGNFRPGLCISSATWMGESDPPKLYIALAMPNNHAAPGFQPLVPVLGAMTNEVSLVCDFVANSTMNQPTKPPRLRYIEPVVIFGTDFGNANMGRTVDDLVELLKTSQC
jgi:hypothetical protein